MFWGGMKAVPCRVLAQCVGPNAQTAVGNDHDHDSSEEDFEDEEGLQDIFYEEESQGDEGEEGIDEEVFGLPVRGGRDTET